MRLNSILQRNKHIWLEHVLAENRRDLEKLIGTLIEDCVYEIVPLGQALHGKKAVAEFYRSLWNAVPDAKLYLQHHYISENGVVEESVLVGNLVGPIFGVHPSGKPISVPIAIFFPIRDGKILGERLYFDPAKFK
ncbi:MAG: ester cyclase [Bacteroidota bacterium]